MLITKDSDKQLCIIVETQEEKELVPTYDDEITTNLNIIDSLTGLGKFVGWTDPETKKFYKAGKEAYIKPAWPYELFGTECGPGWESLIKPLINWIIEYNKTTDNPIEIHQIKEKFGGLRFYVSYEPDELSRMIRKAEGDSYGVCEECGSTIDVGYTSGWIKTICRKCVKDYINKTGVKQIKWKSKDSGVINFITKEGEE